MKFVVYLVNTSILQGLKGEVGWIPTESLVLFRKPRMEPSVVQNMIQFQNKSEQGSEGRGRDGKWGRKCFSVCRSISRLKGRVLHQHCQRAHSCRVLLIRVYKMSSQAEI